MSGKWATAVLLVSVVTSFLNIAIFARQLSVPVRPVNVKGVVAKDWLKDPQFKKAVEQIADGVVEGKDYIDKAEVEALIEGCVVRAGKINC